MNLRQCLSVVFVLAVHSAAQPTNALTATGDSIPVMVSRKAPQLHHALAQELTGYLRQIYPGQQFPILEQLPDSGRCILLGGVPSNAHIKSLVDVGKLTEPESYLITTVQSGMRTLGIIAGADDRGTVFGVYGLLEKLGCGFYLSYDAVCPPRPEPFSFDAWQMSDRPLVRDRLVFNWHNFLSGCSTWNLTDWKKWTLQSQKQGYNAIMVHAYGNNPMVSFRFNGQDKPPGYLSTTVKGRDWSTMHVNDVRRLWGGQVFDRAVFGADAATVPDAERGSAARKLMREVFDYAQQRAMGVFFADDVDTLSANPQAVIQTLPPEARFATTDKSGTVWLANPETPEGYQYYKSQVATLLSDYPQITCLVAWFRNGGTPWMALKEDELPPLWQKEYKALIATRPEAAKYWYSHNLFAIGKIVRAMDRALKELGHNRVELAAGTWRFEFLPPADFFLPSGMKLIGLDYGVLHDASDLGTPEKLRALAEVGQRRPLVPVIWAHHDDGSYIGRPYTPFSDFHSRLADAKAAGFGIIHWTTRPLDLFFASHARQVWAGTRNQTLRATCDDMAARLFGEPLREKMGDYLNTWATESPRLARETSDRFIDRELKEIPKTIAGCGERLAQIASIDAAGLTPAQRDHLQYLLGLEDFMIHFHQTQERFQNAQAALKRRDAAAARAALAECRPEHVIERFARFSSIGGMTRGEQGLVVSMNTRWLSHYVGLRQSLGMEAVRYCFGPTSHDPLAQSPGKFTFHFDVQRHVWQTLGAAETGAEPYTLPAGVSIARGTDLPEASEEICRQGIESDKPLTLTLRPIVHKSALQPGEYRLHLWMLDPVSTAAGQRVFTVSVRSRSNNAADRVDIFALAGKTNAVCQRDYPVAVGKEGDVQVTLTPQVGKVILSAACLEPGATEKR